MLMRSVSSLKSFLRNVGPCSKGTVRVLVVGCHDDDGVIGLGALLYRIYTWDWIEVWYVVLSSHKDHPARRDDIARVTKRLKIPPERVLNLWFEDGSMAAKEPEITAATAVLLNGLDPQVVFVHQGLDLNREHAIVSQITGRAPGKKERAEILILGYEVPKPWGPNEQFHYNKFVPVRAEDVLGMCNLLQMFRVERQRGAPYLDPLWTWSRLVDYGRRAGLSNCAAHAFELISDGIEERAARFMQAIQTLPRSADAEWEMLQLVTALILPAFKMVARASVWTETQS